MNQAMPPKYDWIWAFGLMFLVLALLFPEVLFAPNSGFLQRDSAIYDEDSVKNYYTFWYHLKYDSNILLFSGMNYPFQEHIVFTDNTPLLAMFCWVLRQIGLPVDRYALGVFHYSLVLSSCVATAALVNIFSRFGVTRWIAILWSITLVLLSPQNNRLLAHYSLAYSMVIPILLVLLFSFEDKPSSYKRLIILSIYLTLSSLIHLYYLAIQGILLGTYAVIRLALNKRNLLSTGKLLGFGIVVPFFFVHLWINAAAKASDRPENPYGFLNYRAEWEGVLLHPNTFFHNLFEFIGISVRKIDNYETIAYCGAVAFLITIWLVVRGLFFFRIKKWLQETASLPTPERALRTLVFSVALLALFAHGIPFIIPGMEFLIDYLGPLKQFRSIARFIWTYYWVINIFGMVAIFRWLQEHVHQPLWRNLALASVGVVLTWEATLSIFPIKYVAVRRFNSTEAERTFAREYLNVPQKYPAVIVPLPGMQAGCEWIGRSADEYVTTTTLLLSLYTGSPTTGAQLSRTAQHQCVEQFQTGQELTSPAKIFQNFPDTAMVWMVVRNNLFLDTLSGWSHLLQRAKVIYQDTTISIVEVQQFKYQYLAACKNHQQELLYQFEHPATPPKYELLVPGTTSRSLLFSGNPAIQDTASRWVLSFWLKMPPTALVGLQLNVQSGATLQSYQIAGYMQYIQGGWSLCEIPIQYRAREPLTVSYSYKDATLSLSFKRLLLRPLGYPAIEHQGDTLFLNNRTLTSKSSSNFN